MLGNKRKSRLFRRLVQFRHQFARITIWLIVSHCLVHKNNSLDCFYFARWSEWRDLNPRHLAPQTSALPGCATLRMPVLYPTFKKIARIFMPALHLAAGFGFLFYHSKYLFSKYPTNEISDSYQPIMLCPFLYLPL